MYRSQIKNVIQTFVYPRPFLSNQFFFILIILFNSYTLIFSNSLTKKQAMKSHKTSSSTRFSPILSPLPLPQHLDVQPPTYHKIPPVLWLSHARRQNILLRYRGTSPWILRRAVQQVFYYERWPVSAFVIAGSRLPS